MKVLAPAKINLFLSVGARRPDGLHELCSVMQAVSLHDTLSFSPGPWSVTGVDGVEAGANLALRAARTLASLHGVDEQVAIDIVKRIPMAAGLGGGSADAAGALVGCKELWGLGVSRKALEKTGASLGSDVPFCVRGGTAVVRGAGEDLAALNCRAPVWWVLGISDTGLSTAEVYAEFDRIGAPGIDDPYEVADALARADVARLAGALRNDLQTAAVSLRPSIGEGVSAMRDGGALAAMVSGSGPTVIGLASSEEHAHSIARACANAFARIETVHSLDHGPRVIER